MANNLDEALRLLDRKRLPADLGKVVQGSRTREQAERRLADHFGEEPSVSPQGDPKDDEIAELRAKLAEKNQGTGTSDQSDPDEDDESEDEDEEIEAEDYDGWSKADLQAECEERDLPRTGKVADLIARLEEDDAE